MTEEKDKQFAEALESLKDVQGPVMIAMQKAPQTNFGDK